MRRLWSVVSFMSVVNLLALLIFGGWLWATERIDGARLRRVRDMLALTIPQEAAESAEREAAAAQERADQAAGERRANPLLPSEAEITKAALQQRRTSEAARLLRDEASRHLAELERRAGELDEREAAVEARRDAWEASIADEVRRRADEQFQKALALYESLAGKQAKRMLLELVDQGEIDQAVAYLDAMDRRAAAKTLKELKTDEENKLATELLERVRTFGIESEVTEIASHEPAPPVAPE